MLSSCTSEIKTIAKHLSSPHEMWEALRARLNNQESQAACTRIRDSFGSARIGKEKKVGERFTACATTASSSQAPSMRLETKPSADTSTKH